MVRHSAFFRRRRRQHAYAHASGSARMSGARREVEDVWVFENRSEAIAPAVEAAAAAILPPPDGYLTGCWLPMNSPLGDVDAADGRWDGKRGFVQMQRYAPNSIEPCLGFMGSTARDLECRDGSAGYVVGVADPAKVHVDPKTLTVTFAPIQITALYVIPRDDVNRLFRQPYITDGTRRSRGANLYCPLAMLEPYRHTFAGSAP